MADEEDISGNMSFEEFQEATSGEPPFYFTNHTVNDPANDPMLADQETIARACIEREPDEAGGHHMLGNVLLLRGDRLGARAEWQRVIEIRAAKPGGDNDGWADQASQMLIRYPE